MWGSHFTKKSTLYTSFTALTAGYYMLQYANSKYTGGNTIGTHTVRLKPECSRLCKEQGGCQGWNIKKRQNRSFRCQLITDVEATAIVLHEGWDVYVLDDS